MVVNKIGDEGAKAVSEMLKVNTRIRELDLSGEEEERKKEKERKRRMNGRQ